MINIKSSQKTEYLRNLTDIISEELYDTAKVNLTSNIIL